MREGDGAVMIGSPNPCLENVSQVQKKQDKPQALFNVLTSFIISFSIILKNFQTIIKVAKLQTGNENHY